MSTEGTPRGTKRAASCPCADASSHVKRLSPDVDGIKQDAVRDRLIGHCMSCLEKDYVLAVRCDTPQCPWGVCYKCVQDMDRRMLPPRCVCGEHLSSNLPNLGRHRPRLEGKLNGCPCEGQIWQVFGLPDRRLHVCPQTTLGQVSEHRPPLCSSTVCCLLSRTHSSAPQMFSGGVCPVAKQLGLCDLEKHYSSCSHEFCQRQELWRSLKIERARRAAEERLRRMLAATEGAAAVLEPQP